MIRAVRVLLAVIGLLVLAAGCSTDGAQQGETTLDQESQAEGITVIGNGRISGEPDTLRATVGVEVERPSVEAALNTANAAASRVTSALRSRAWKSGIYRLPSSQCAHGSPNLRYSPHRQNLKTTPRFVVT